MAEKAGYISKPIKSIGTKEVFAFSDFLDAYTRDEEGNAKVGFSKKTFSNFISTLRTMWTVFTTREILKDNPYFKVVKRKGRSGQHIPYSPAQVRKYKEVCLDEIRDKQLWLFVNFIYYCFLRPAEEAQNLQIKYILKKTIVIPGEIAKNNLTEHVRIPKGLQKLIEEYHLRSFPGHYYIFTLAGEPGLKPVGNKYMYMHNKKVLDQAKFTDQDYDLYGWKHTGNIALYLATKDIKLVQAQNRHKDISTTDKYLRDLGLFLDEDALDLFPEAGTDI
jgi:integrase